MARVFPERFVPSGKTKGSIYPRIEPRTIVKVPQFYTTSRNPSVMEKKTQFENPVMEDFEYRGPIATPATMLEKYNPRIRNAMVLEEAKVKDLQLVMSEYLQDFLEEENPHKPMRGVDKKFWNYARQVLISNDPIALDRLVKILKTAQLKGILYFLDEDGMIQEGTMLSNCPPDLKDDIHDLFVKYKLYDLPEDTKTKYYGPYLIEYIKDKKGNVILPKRINPRQQNIRLDLLGMAKEDYPAINPNRTTQEKEQADISDDLSTNSGVSVEPLSVFYGNEDRDYEYKRDDTPDTERSGSGIKRYSGLTKYPLLYSLSKPHIRSIF